MNFRKGSLSLCTTRRRSLTVFRGWTPPANAPTNLPTQTALTVFEKKKEICHRARAASGTPTQRDGYCKPPNFQLVVRGAKLAERLDLSQGLGGRAQAVRSRNVRSITTPVSQTDLVRPLSICSLLLSMTTRGSCGIGGRRGCGMCIHMKNPSGPSSSVLLHWRCCPLFCSNLSATFCCSTPL